MSRKTRATAPERLTGAPGDRTDRRKRDLYMDQAVATAAPPTPRPENQPLELRGETFALATIEVHDPNPEAFEAALNYRFGGTEFFRGSPVVLEFGPACRASITDPAALAAAARAHGLLPVGFRPSEPGMDDRAAAAGLAKIPDTPIINAAPPKWATVILDGPVRSGQSVYADGGDLVIIGPVSERAE